MPETTRLWWPNDSWTDGAKRYAPTNFQTRRLEIFSWNTNKYCRFDTGNWTPNRDVEVSIAFYQSAGTTNVVYLDGAAKSTYKPTSGSPTLRKYTYKYDSTLRTWMLDGVAGIVLVGDANCPTNMPGTVDEWLARYAPNTSP